MKNFFVLAIVLAIAVSAVSTVSAFAKPPSCNPPPACGTQGQPACPPPPACGTQGQPACPIVPVVVPPVVTPSVNPCGETGFGGATNKACAKKGPDLICGQVKERWNRGQNVWELAKWMLGHPGYVFCPAFDDPYIKDPKNKTND